MLNERVRVGLEGRSYDIVIGAGVLGGLPSEIERIGFPRRIALVTNPRVGALYAGALLQLLRGAGCSVERIDIPDGEEYKTLATVAGVYDTLMDRGLDRGCGLIALGGGVVGDLAGFVAATFLRGIPFIQIPTTLLSQVDSSVGGKTGVNLPAGKNLVGAFWQPQLVVIDTATLATLETRDFVAGLAEVVKYGAIRDREFFAWLESHSADILAGEPATLTRLIKRSCQIKADIVERDERESSLRAILNFGHTYGHAVEHLAGYGEFRHGEAVAIGMVAAAEIALDQGLCTADDVARLRRMLLSFGLPVDSPPFSVDEVVASVAKDKKVHAGRLRMVLNLGIGACELRDTTDPRTVFARVLPRLQSN